MVASAAAVKKQKSAEERKELAEAEIRQLANDPLSNLFAFWQCQLLWEAIHCFGASEHQVPLADPRALSLWSEYQQWQKKNKSERWVPYHTVFGVHELYAVRDIKSSAHGWDDRQKFLALFVFRAHCKRDLFEEVQLPAMRTQAFWADPVEACAPEGEMEVAMLEYRKRTGLALQTNAFRAIPRRILKDDDENLVRNVMLRTQSLLGLAEQLWPLVKENSLKPEELFARMSKHILAVNMLGETWVKMLCASIDISYPHLKLLQSQCSVGVGALDGMELLLQDGLHGGTVARLNLELSSCKDMVNMCREPTAEHFWAYLDRVEQTGREVFRDSPAILSQLHTERQRMSSVTLQVQFCEWRQFCDHLERVSTGE